MDSVILSRFDGHETLPERVVVWVGGAYKWFCHWTNGSGGGGAKASITCHVLLLHAVGYFAGCGSFGCLQWKLSRFSSYKSRMSDSRNQDVSDVGLSNCSTRYLNLHPIFWTSKTFLIFKGFSLASASWGSILGWAILRRPSYCEGSVYCLRRLTLKTGWSLEKDGGNNRRYTFFPTSWRILKGPILWKSSFPDGWGLWMLHHKTITKSPGLNSGACECLAS